MLRSLVVLLVAAVPLVAAPVPKSIKPKPSGLDGRWQIVELWSGMSDVTKLNPWLWEVEGDSLVIYMKEGDKLVPYEKIVTMTLVRPANGGAEDVDYTRTERGMNPMLFPGIVTVSGDEMVFCFNGPGLPRPTEQKPFQSGWYYKFKRLPEK